MKLYKVTLNFTGRYKTWLVVASSMDKAESMLNKILGPGGWSKDGVGFTSDRYILNIEVVADSDRGSSHELPFLAYDELLDCRDCTRFGDAYPECSDCRFLPRGNHFEIVSGSSGSSTPWRERWRSRVAFCKRHVDVMSEWELGFIDSMDVLLSSGNDLTFNQSKKLGEVYHSIEDAI